MLYDMNLKIDDLVIERDRSEHIAKHKVTIKEAKEIVIGDYVYIKGKLGRWLLIGKTRKRRFLTVVVGERGKADTYGLITARPSSKEERSFYLEFTLTQGGEENGKN